MKPMKTLFKPLAVATAIAAGSLHAATISWTANDITAGNGAADVSTTGTLVDARDGGNADVTVNGVTFLSVSTGSTAAGYNLFDSLFAVDNISDRGGANPTETYVTFLASGQRSGRNGATGNTHSYPRTDPANDWATVNFTSLTIGNIYEVQIWASDTNQILGDAGNKGLLLGNGAANVNPDINNDTMLLYEYADGATTSDYGLGGQYGTGTFVADATTQSFNVRTYNNLLTTPSATSGDHFSNGLQVRDLGVIPEPSTTALLGLGGLALIFRRRR
jgi:hypothetical protein